MSANPDSSLKILVVDDERPIRRFLNASLGNRYTILEAENGGDAIQSTAVNHPDLVILDLGLPDMDGTEVTQRLREWTDVPVIVISVRDSEEDKVAALDAGADDYLTKPFGTSELLARIRVALRHSNKTESESAIYQNNGLIIDFIKREVRVEDRLITLTPTEYNILKILVTHAGKVLTHHQLIKEVWGGNYEADSHLLRVNVSNLRRKIETDTLKPQYIITEPGVGYRLKET
ncbi:MAG: response regulator transcription factor [Chloroflexi bacterium]|jgi:two-component system KDP operon response regulator KdpE|nr:response regulator transcription factor [Chloroflexota bacterium]